MMTRLALLLLIVVVAAGCAGGPSSITPRPSGPIATVAHPNVVQSGSHPSHWVSFPIYGPVGITRGPDGNLWFSALGRIDKIDYAGSMTGYGIGLSRLSDITTGHDGKLWFVDVPDGYLCSITTTGNVNYYIAPVSGGITAGPQGSVWFAAGSGIAKITPTGKITFFPIPDQVNEIAEGRDGNLWFTIYSQPASVGKMTPQGAFTVYPISYGSGSATSIASGPDGNLWVLLSASNFGSVARITTAGKISVFPLPGEISSSNRIISGPGGSLWYTRDSTSTYTQYVGQITTVGKITEHKYPANDPFNSPLGGIAAGIDGNLWFTQTPTSSGSINVYVRLVLTVKPTSITFSGVGQSQNITVSETDYPGTWTASTSDSTVATVQQGSSANVFVVTSTGSGTATIVVADAKNNFFDVPVSVP